MTDKFRPLAWLRSEQKRYEALPKLEDGQIQRRAEEFRRSADALETALRERYVCRGALEVIAAGIPGPRLLAVEALTGIRQEGADEKGVLACLGCGLPYRAFPLDVNVPDEQWQTITGRTDGSGVMCASCLVKRGAKLPGITYAELVFHK